jgi:hypothetical protein
MSAIFFTRSRMPAKSALASEQITCERGALSYLTKLKKEIGIEAFCRPSVPSILLDSRCRPANSVFATERMAHE